MAALDEKFRYRTIGMAVLAVEGQPHRRAVLQLYAARALDVHDEGFHRVRKVKYLQTPAGEGPRLDFTAGCVGHKSACSGPRRGQALAGQTMPLRQRAKIVRPAVNRHRVGG